MFFEERTPVWHSHNKRTPFTQTNCLHLGMGSRIYVVHANPRPGGTQVNLKKVAVVRGIRPSPKSFTNSKKPRRTYQQWLILCEHPHKRYSTKEIDPEGCTNYQRRNPLGIRCGVETKHTYTPATATTRSRCTTNEVSMGLARRRTKKTRRNTSMAC